MLPTRRGRDTNRPTNGSKQGDMTYGVFVREGFGPSPPETIRDSRTEFNTILCTSKSEAAVTSNKKLRCRYVEADYRQTRSITRPLCDSWASVCEGFGCRAYRSDSAVMTRQEAMKLTGRTLKTRQLCSHENLWAWTTAVAVRQSDGVCYKVLAGYDAR